MKFSRIMIFCCLGFMSSIFMYSCFQEVKAANPFSDKSNSPSELQWHSMEEINKLQEKEPRKVLVDIYTDWCKWCHVMDEKTFTDPQLIQVLNKEFYLVKLNAETKKDITYKGITYQFKNNGRRGYHSLAATLVNDQLSYPSFVVLDNQLNVVDVTRGFKNAPQFQDFLSRTTL